MLKHSFKVGQAFVAEAMRDFRYAQVCFLQIPLGLADPVNIGVFTDGISGNFLENAADVGFAQEKFLRQFL